MSNNNNEDRISLLPDCLLHDIMSFLTMTEVVQTCVLSKRWKTLWTSIPTLNFEFNYFPFLTYKWRGRLLQFYQSMPRVLSKLCASQVIKLRYSAPWHCESKESQKLVNCLIDYVACHKVHELCILTYREEDGIDWVRCLSSCRSVNVLKIRIESNSSKWGDLNLQSLRILEIEAPFCPNTQYRDRMFSGCPNLESLVITGFYCEHGASICAPKLENLELCYIRNWIPSNAGIDLFTPNLRCVKFENVFPTLKSDSDFKCLDQVHLAVDRETSRRVVVQFLQVFHNARSITLPLSAAPVLLSDPFSLAEISFHHLRHLKFEVKKTSEKMDFPINELQDLFNCPTLEIMVIDH